MGRFSVGAKCGTPYLDSLQVANSPGFPPIGSSFNLPAPWREPLPEGGCGETTC